MSYLRCLFCFMALAATSLAPAQAAADERVFVLQASSEAVDVDFATSLSGVLRHAARQIPLWQVSDQSIATDEVTLALGCTAITDECLSQAAESLEADVIIVPTITRQGNRYRVSLVLYRQSAGAITGTVEDDFPRVQSDIDELRPRVSRYLDELGARAPASVEVRVGEPGAEVLLDGARIGETDADGNAHIPEVSAGAHRLEVRAEGRPPYSVNLTLEPNQTLVHQVSLGESADENPVEAETFSDINWRRVTSYSLIATGVALSAVMVWEWLTLGGIDGSTNFTNARNITSPDVCTVNRAAVDVHNGMNPDMTVDFDQLQQQCSDIGVHEPLQFVFGGLSLASLGIGLYLLISDGGDDDAAESLTEARFTLQPHFGPRSASVSARLEF